jgi:hypothetical protein
VLLLVLLLVLLVLALVLLLVLLLLLVVLLLPQGACVVTFLLTNRAKIEGMMYLGGVSFSLSLSFA